MAPTTGLALDKRAAARRARDALAVVVALSLLAACGAPRSTPPALPITRADVVHRVVPVSDARAVPDVVTATDRLGAAMLASAPREGNVVVSPASAVVALSMLAEGAREETAASLDEALGAVGPERTAAVGALLAALQEHDGNPAAVQAAELPEEPLAHLANQVVVDDQAAIHDTYLEALGAGYGAGVLRTDLGTDAGLAPLSDWARYHTGGLVERSAIEPDPDLRLVLQNATLFAARWEEPFEESETGPQPFVLGSGEEVQAEALRQTNDARYAEVDGWRAVRLPYVEAFHADVLLPPPGTDPASITAEQHAALREALDAAAPVPVDLTMPTLDVPAESPTDLRPALTDLGLGRLLGLPTLPDLSGISDQGLVVSQAWQQSVLQVDAEGTVAAAVTEIGVTEEAAAIDVLEPVVLRVDRPYVFSVAHSDTGWTLFTSAIRDPRH
ncbi:serpin family protein [Cellulosimicrobium sp. CUA-896]|uniref:serpin family protein n=1 Tax=Cellulosimicrobium sp. CUA-896 TaxID=1517881 RepID=UPI0009FA9AA5|nr:serpin family protein [Cellulosimicrobium sp. CUA-896]